MVHHGLMKGALGGVQLDRYRRNFALEELRFPGFTADVAFEPAYKVAAVALMPEFATGRDKAGFEKCQQGCKALIIPIVRGGGQEQ